MKYIITAIVISTLFISCEKKLDIDLPDSEKHIVVNGLMNPMETIGLEITKSQNILDKNDNLIYLPDAVVKLYSNNEFIQNLVYSDSGNYTSSVFPEIGQEYQITVDAGDLNSVSADNRLLSAVPISAIDTTITLNQIDEYETENGALSEYEIHYELKIDDNSTQNNFYFLSVSYREPFFEYDYYTGEQVYIEHRIQEVRFDSKDLVFNDGDQDFNINGMQGKVLSDELFNGNEYTLNMSTYYYPISDYMGNILEPRNLKIYIMLLSVNEDLYKYIKSYNKNQTTINNPFAQPVQVFSNIENGLGLFSGYTMYIDSLNFEY